MYHVNNSISGVGDLAETVRGLLVRSDDVEADRVSLTLPTGALHRASNTHRKAKTASKMRSKPPQRASIPACPLYLVFADAIVPLKGRKAELTPHLPRMAGLCVAASGIP